MVLQTDAKACTVKLRQQLRKDRNPGHASDQRTGHGEPTFKSSLQLEAIAKANVESIPGHSCVKTKFKARREERTGSGFRVGAGIRIAFGQMQFQARPDTSTM